MASVESGKFHADNIRDAVREGVEWLENNGGEQVIEREPGEIILDKNGIKNSISHGFSQAKLDMVPAIPSVLKEQIDPELDEKENLEILTDEAREMVRELESSQTLMCGTSATEMAKEAMGLARGMEIWDLLTSNENLKELIIMKAMEEVEGFPFRAETGKPEEMDGIPESLASWAQQVAYSW